MKDGTGCNRNFPKPYSDRTFIDKDRIVGIDYHPFCFKEAMKHDGPLQDQTAHTCGMTGDGVNDASALKKGDIHIVDADNVDTTRGASVAKDVARYVKDATMGSISDKSKMAKGVADCITFLLMIIYKKTIVLHSFHGIINKKRSQLAIRGVFVDGIWNNDPRSVKEAFHNHYEARFKKPTTSGLKLNFPFPKRLLQDQVVDLERCVSRDEIRLAVWNCRENKSPGPDGYTFEFSRKYWEFVGPDFCEAVEHFFVNGSFSKGCNSSFIALIPKVIDAKFVYDYRPISRIGSVYKVVMKIMANQLALVIADIVFDTQSAFVAERHILDCSFILNEVLHWCKRKNKKAMFFKVDFAKAYDSVRWDYLIDVLEAFGFGLTWCKWIRESVSYLGVMVGECMSHHKAWVDVVLKLRSRLSKWKAKTLSIGGRLTLLKSVLGASPLYSMSIFKAAWDKVLASKKKGGLGVSSFYALNRALLLKWVWRFVSQDGSLWFRVIQALYGPMIDTHSVHKALSWCSIMREVHLLKTKGFDFLSHCNKRIGDGNNTRFWLDIWKGDRTLRDAFPRMFALESVKQIFVAEKMVMPVDYSFRRPVRGGIEQQQFTDLASTMDSVSLSSSHDRWVCNLSGDGEFRVKEVRNFIDDLFIPSHPEPTRWVKYIPIKINIFAWRARRDCLPTRVNLIRRGVTLESSNCPLCLSCEEDVHHVFFQCDLARAVLRRVCQWWDLDWQLWSSFSDWYS
nr:RNA-directed DNA polymerase, eukaryota [Tanacetum cinerariifolium]